MPLSQSVRPDIIVITLLIATLLIQTKNPPPKLLDQVRERIRVKHYNIRTERQYVQWIKRFILYHGKRHPQEMGMVEVEAFLTHLAVEGKVSASMQNQALSALLFLYKEVLSIDLPWLNNVVREAAATFAECADAYRGEGGVGADDRHPWFDGQSPVRYGHALDGMFAPSRLMGKRRPVLSFFQSLDQ
ncbi:phage integrase N-terminal SAM-like domain-containing protein [Methylobacter sp. BBA5.1]|uniref:phage integrase N-terminal SAM-like domain-containing protein n=1 Tax=Methylobacter sp. BBA5.1 TaxID=1495064 RepID=UPI001F27B0EC|nr:phage integrase N-terminal SAM-like domain-containing protein [Methylobacter sp. BBA5.1]